MKKIDMKMHKTALRVLDPQNDLTDPDAKLGLAGQSPYGVMSAVIANQAMLKGTYGGDISELFARQDDDVVLHRSATIAFDGTRLESMLESRAIETLVICGMLSDVCVEGTMRAAYSKGYQVFTVTDATATLNLEKYEYTVQNNFPLFSKPFDTKLAMALG